MSHDTWSRTQLLAVRGYSPDQVAGNGHTPHPMAAGWEDGHSRLVEPVEADPEPELRNGIAQLAGQKRSASGSFNPGTATPQPRFCEQCGSPFTGRDLKRFCSDSCRRKASRPAATPRSRTDVTSGPEPALNGTTGSMSPIGPISRDRLGPIYQLLMLAGATVVRIEVTTAEETWLITRSINERNRP
jgi:hypothetical protein